MEIKNEALKSLYECLISGIWSFCPCIKGTKDDIDTAFKKCDDELEKELEAIREESLRNIREGYKTECDLKELKQKYDYLERSHKRLGDIRNRLAKENEDLKQQNKKVGERCEEETEMREYWRLQCNGRGDRIRNLEKENEDLKQQLDAECEKRCDLQERLDDVGKRYYESVQRVGKLVREKETLQNQLGSSNAAIGRLRERYEEEVVCRRKWAKLAVSRDKQIEELLKTGYGIDVDEVYKLKGMEELCGMIREVNSATIESLYNSGAFNNKVCVGTMVDMYTDVRDFVKEYKAWKGCAEEEKKEKEEEQNKQKCLDDMRDYLHKFCENRWCDGCPLSTDEFKCGRGYRFRKWYFPDNGAIPDEDLKRYYEKVRDWEKKGKNAIQS